MTLLQQLACCRASITARDANALRAAGSLTVLYLQLLRVLPASESMLVELRLYLLGRVSHKDG